jgi:hypothetical protein
MPEQLVRAEISAVSWRSDIFEPRNGRKTAQPSAWVRNGRLGNWHGGDLLIAKKPSLGWNARNIKSAGRDDKLRSVATFFPGRFITCFCVELVDKGRASK